QIRAAPGAGDQIDRLGGVTDENAFPRIGRIDELRRDMPRFLVAQGRLLGKLVDPAMDIGIRARIEIADRVDDHGRALRRRGAIEKYERQASLGRRLLEDRKVLANGETVNRRGLRGYGHWVLPAADGQ